VPNYVGFVDDTGQTANKNFVQFVKEKCELAGWTINRYDTAGAEHYLLMAAPGYTGPDGPVKAYVGMRTYDSVASDYYNISVSGMTGYASGNSYDTQPGFVESGIPTHNQRIDYWLTINDRRVAFGLKVGTPVYEHGYAGFMLPYATPRQFPYPLVIGGMLSGVPATRYSETTHSMPYKGSRANFIMRSVSGTYLSPATYPWNNVYLAGGQGIRPGGTYYPLPRVVLCDASPNLYGELDGVHYMTGFDNVVENTLVVGGKTYVVIQDVARTGFIDYIALRLDT
jgi:hypothetical protein